MRKVTFTFKHYLVEMVSEERCEDAPKSGDTCSDTTMTIAHKDEVTKCGRC